MAVDRTHPIRVVHIITNLSAGGAERMLYKLLTRIDGELFESDVISMVSLGYIGECIEKLGVKVHVLGLSRGKLNAMALPGLVKLLRSLRPDIIQTWMFDADLAGFLAGRLAGVRRIAWNIRCSEHRPDESSRVTRAAIRACALLSRYPSIVIANAVAGRRAYEAVGYRPREWKIIPNGFELDAYKPDPEARLSVRQELGVPIDAPLIGIVGRYHPMKDHKTFLVAARRLHELRPDVHFMMAGVDLVTDNAKLVEPVADHPVMSRMHFLGERRDVARLMASLDLFALTSHGGEGFPNVVGEAMSCGIPCVVSEKAGDAANIVGETGVVIPASNPEALTEAWLNLLNADESARRELGYAARERVEKLYNLEAIVKQYQDLYVSLMARN